jgi:ParB family transcriptional regulator, chromosome partitioning protein
MNVSELRDGQCLRVPLDMLVDAPWGNVRRGDRNPNKFEELKSSIATRGVIQGITVRPNDETNTLETLAGYGRRDASKAAGLSDIPVIIKRVDDKEGIAIGLAENLQREDLTLRDEIIMSQQFVSLADGDYAEAARALGWEERKVRARIKLNDCSEAVLEALGKGEIKLGHAEVLCQFTHKLQDGTLANILAEGWTVDYLKERANKAARLLRYAKFDTAACESCPHNSSVQASLFDNHIGGSKCGNLVCYREKTEAWVAARKAELEAEEGKVFLAVEKPASDRRTVGPEVVGEAVFTTECLACVSRVRILQDGINRDCGDVTENQCVNLVCFKQKIAAKEAAEAEGKKSSGTDKAATKSAAKAAASTGKPKAKATAVAVPASVKQQAEGFVRQVIGEQLLTLPTYGLAVSLVSLAHLTGYTIPNLKAGAGVPQKIAELTGWEGAALAGEIKKAIAHGTLDASSGMSFNGKDVVLATAKRVETRKEVATAAWKPTKEWLDTYLKGGIEALCRDPAVGFDKAYDAEKGTGAFTKLMKAKKELIIGGILGFNFDWSAAVPGEVRALVE